MSNFEKIVRFISDIDVKTTIPQNIVFAVLFLFLFFATGQYALKQKICYFLVIISLFFVILCVFRNIYNIKTEFTVLCQSFALLVSCMWLFIISNDYKKSTSFRKGLVYGKMLPDGLHYYMQSNQLDSEIDFRKDKFIINFFEVFNETYKTIDVLCLVKTINKKTHCEETMLMSFEEVLAMLGEVQYKNIKLCDIWLKTAELLAEKSKDVFYTEIIDKIKVYKKRFEMKK